MRYPSNPPTVLDARKAAIDLLCRHESPADAALASGISKGALVRLANDVTKKIGDHMLAGLGFDISTEIDHMSAREIIEKLTELHGSQGDAAIACGVSSPRFSYFLRENKLPGYYVRLRFVEALKHKAPEKPLKKKSDLIVCAKAWPWLPPELCEIKPRVIGSVNNGY